MSHFSRIVLEIARLIAGRERAEWMQAMAAEAASVDGSSNAWALGCLWASVKDRIARDWSFGAAILLLAASAYFLKTTIFFWTSGLLVHQHITPSFAVAMWILSAFPVPFLFANWRPGARAYLAAILCFLVVELFPIAMMWVKFGLSPLIWFGPNSNWYKADPGVRIGPAAGLTLDLAVWLSAAWLGSSFRRRFSR